MHSCLLVNKVPSYSGTVLAAGQFCLVLIHCITLTVKCFANLIILEYTAWKNHIPLQRSCGTVINQFIYLKGIYFLFKVQNWLIFYQVATNLKCLTFYLPSL